MFITINLRRNGLNNSFLLDNTKLILYNINIKYYRKAIKNMTEENKMLNEELDLNDNPNEEKDPLKEAIEEKFKQLQTQSMLVGAQSICHVILQKIAAFEKQPGKRTLNDHRRLFKDIKQFCKVGISRRVNLDGTTSPISEEEVAENSTKLMEEVNESNQ